MSPASAIHWTTLVEAADLKAALAHPQLRLVDARFALMDPVAGRQAYLQSHLPGAVFADLNDDLSDLGRTGEGRHPLPDSADFVGKLGGWGIGQADQIVVYDNGDGSMAAARLWWMLKLLGHARVAVLNGGMAAWRAEQGAETADLPVVTMLAPYPAQFDNTAVVQADEILARRGNAPGWLLDARAGERFRGEVEPIDPRAGHVPGAVNRPFLDNLQQGRFKSAQSLREEILPLLSGYTPNEAVLMCGSGVTACHLLLAFEHAGLHGARVYAGSWSGWISDPSRPVS